MKLFDSHYCVTDEEHKHLSDLIGECGEKKPVKVGDDPKKQ
ncbi:hypothetical protein OESDEN_11979, partial [Oesophagostomum dentatum]